MSAFSKGSDSGNNEVGGGVEEQGTAAVLSSASVSESSVAASYYSSCDTTVTSGSAGVILEEEEDEGAEEDVISSSIEEPSPSSSSASLSCRPPLLPSYEDAINSTRLQSSHNNVESVAATTISIPPAARTRVVLNNEATLTSPSSSDVNKETDSASCPVVTYHRSDRGNPTSAVAFSGAVTSHSSSHTHPLVSSISSAYHQHSANGRSANSGSSPVDGTTTSKVVSGATAATVYVSAPAAAGTPNPNHTANLKMDSKKVVTKDATSGSSGSSKPQIEYVVLI